jgi:putative PEP-CTERM system TPR-repeat lipoprotein
MSHCLPMGAMVLALLLSACGQDSEEAIVAKTKAAVVEGDLARATIHAKNALQQHPASGPLRFALGKIFLDAGDADSAEIELRKALELKHSPDQVMPLLAQALFSRHQYVKVIQEFGATTLGDASQQADLQAIVARAHAQTGHPEKATALLDATLARDPRHVPSRLLQARIMAGSGNVVGALAIVGQALDTAPKDADALRLKADFQMLQGDKAAASAGYRSVLQVLPGDIHSHTQLIAAHLLDRDLKAAKEQLRVLTKRHPANLQTRFMHAHVALVEGDYVRAREISAQLMRLVKDNPKLLYVAGAAELHLNSLVQAESFLTRALAGTPESKPVRRLLATAYLRGGQPQKAITLLLPLTESASPDVEALSLAAMAHLASGNTSSAQAFFARVVKLKPDDVKARTALALAQLGKGNADAALADLQSIAASDQGTLADMALINARLGRREHAAALQAIDALERKLPTKPYAPDLRGRVFLAQGLRDKAQASFEQAVSRDPVFFPSIAALSELDAEQGRLPAAQARYEAVLKVDSKSVQAMVALAEVRARQGAPAAEVEQWLTRAISAKPSEASSHVLLVSHWLRLRQAKQAIAAAQAGLTVNPDEPVLLDALGRAQLAAGEAAQAATTFSKLSLVQPRSAHAQLRLADAYMAAKNLAAAEGALKKAQALEPDMIAPRRGQIYLAIQNKRLDKALQVARDVQKSQPDEALGYLLEADVHAASKDWDATAKALRGGLAKKDGSAAAVRLHTVLMTARKAPEAERFASEWLKQHPKDTRLLSHLASAALASGDNGRAEQLYTEVVKLAPNDAAAANNLAWLLASGRKPGAIDWARRAVTLAPASGKYLDTLAYALAEDNQLEQAVKTQKDAVKLEPNQPMLRLQLAKLQLRSDDKAGARAELDMLAKMGDKFSRQQEVSDLLKRL